jgi:hypothetical protein
MGGVLEITPGVAKIMQGDPTMATTPFGAHSKLTLLAYP